MDINQIRYAIKIIELKNFTKAAEVLFITQPTLSQQINKLENTLNVKLFNRTTRSFSVTEAGEIFYKKAKIILNSIDDLETTMYKYQNVERKALRIGILPTLSKIGLTAKIAYFMQYNKGVEIEFVEDFSENLLSMIINKKIDVALINRIAFVNKLEEKMLDYFNLFEDRIAIIASINHRFNDKTSLNINMLGGEPIIKLPDKSSITKIMRAEFRKYGIEANIVYECINTSTLIDMVDEGMGISFLSSKVAEKYKTDRTKIIKLTPKITNKTAVVALKGLKDSPLLKRFYKELIK